MIDPMEYAMLMTMNGMGLSGDGEAKAVRRLRKGIGKVKK